MKNSADLIAISELQPIATFQEGKAKILLGVCRGKRQHDKREAVKKAGAQREIQRALRGK